MGKTQREQPKHLSAKLLAIRKALKASQSQMVKRIGIKMSPARISQYENGVREPNLLVLLGYARAAKVRMEIIIDDRLSLPSKFD